MHVYKMLGKMLYSFLSSLNCHKYLLYQNILLMLCISVEFVNILIVIEKWVYNFVYVLSDGVWLHCCTFIYRHQNVFIINVTSILVKYFKYIT